MSLIFAFVFLNLISVSAQINYSDVVNYGNGYIISREDGCITHFSLDGKALQTIKISSNINHIESYNNVLYASGYEGVYKSSNGVDFEKLDLNQEIVALTICDSKLVIGTQSGLFIYKNGSFQPINLELNDKIVSLASYGNDCYGVTLHGKVFFSRDACDTWTIFDFNTSYSGYYPECEFTAVSVGASSVAIVGKQSDNKPAMYISSEGKVWTARDLLYTNSKNDFSALLEIPRDIVYDMIEDQYIMVCDNGVLFFVPPCSHCNKRLTPIGEDLLHVAISDNTVLMLGRNVFEFYTFR